jgi:ADP-ribose pyrophosphatase YjhB (NUDIX family)
MPDERRFARLSVQPSEARGTFSIPDDGMCLSTFLVVHPPGAPGQVLLGRVRPEGPWNRVACMNAEGLARVGDRWLLPATQLLLFEGPDEAARRIAQEMIGRQDLPFGSPAVYSEAYPRPLGRDDRHWDLHFVYTVPWPDGRSPPSPNPLWRELRFVDVGQTPADAFGRGHGDVLALTGRVPRSVPPP